MTETITASGPTASCRTDRVPGPVVAGLLTVAGALARDRGLSLSPASPVVSES